MKTIRIKFDFGTQQNVPLNIVELILGDLVDGVNKAGLKAGKCVVYMSLYDQNGVEKILTYDDKERDYIIRSKPYQRIQKDTEYIGPIASIKDDVRKEIAYIYHKYVPISR